MSLYEYKNCNGSESVPKISVCYSGSPWGNSNRTCTWMYCTWQTSIIIKLNYTILLFFPLNILSFQYSNVLLPNIIRLRKQFVLGNVQIRPKARIKQMQKLWKALVNKAWTDQLRCFPQPLLPSTSSCLVQFHVKIWLVISWYTQYMAQSSIILSSISIKRMRN